MTGAPGVNGRIHSWSLLSAGGDEPMLQRREGSHTTCHSMHHMNARQHCRSTVLPDVGFFRLVTKRFRTRVPISCEVVPAVAWVAFIANRVLLLGS
jgi:hypothetical protein